MACRRISSSECTPTTSLVTPGTTEAAWRIALACAYWNTEHQCCNNDFSIALAWKPSKHPSILITVISRPPEYCLILAYQTLTALAISEGIKLTMTVHGLVTSWHDFCTIVRRTNKQQMWIAMYRRERLGEEKADANDADFGLQDLIAVGRAKSWANERHQYCSGSLTWLQTNSLN